jgi:hypothetical protein
VLPLPNNAGAGAALPPPNNEEVGAYAALPPPNNEGVGAALPPPNKLDVGGPFDLFSAANKLPAGLLSTLAFSKLLFAPPKRDPYGF